MRWRTPRPELLLVLLAAVGCGGSDGAENGPIVANRAGGIYLVDPNSGRASEIPGLDDFSLSAVSPDGRMLALSSGLDLYVARLDGTALRRVIGNAYDASWSPNGEQLVFTRDACAYRGEDCYLLFDHTAELAVVDVDGSNLRRLTFDMVYQGQPDWSPDGERIAFEGDAGVYVMDVDGDNPRLLARQVSGPRWSPDGRRLVVGGSLSRPAASLLILDLESGRGTRFRTPRGPLYGPEWSPDGRQIVYSGLRVDEWTAHEPLQIWVMQSDGSRARPVTSSVGWSTPTWAARD